MLRQAIVMSGFVASLLCGGAGLLAAQPAPIANPPEPASVPAHLARAKSLAGKDAFPLWVATEGYWCKAPAEGRASAFANATATTGVPPIRMFDNLYYVGKDFVGVLILKTSAGLVMWDALDNPTEAKEILIPGMKKLGLDPRDIKLIILTHGHFDHFGGAKYMHDTYHIPVAASDVDWGLMADYKSDGTDAHPVPPARDRVLADGEIIRVGDADIRFVFTPGHTQGTVSSLIPVKDKGVTRVMAMWGGTAYPATAEALSQMGASMAKFKDAAVEAGAVGFLNDHARFFNAPALLAARAAGTPNPLVIGTPDVARTFDVMSECLSAMKDWYKAMGKS